jgi:hypothetical protein
VTTSPAERVAQIAIDLCNEHRDGSGDVTHEAAAHRRLAREAGGSRAVLLDAYVACMTRSAAGDPAAERAAQLLDEVQATDLVS